MHAAFLPVRTRLRLSAWLTLSAHARRWARHAPLSLLLPFFMVGSGCSVLAPKPETQAPAAPVIKLEVTAPPALAELLARNLDLGRVNRLARGEPLQEGELDRLVAATPQQARELLDTEGYFNAEVSVVRSEAGGLPTVRVAVQPGPRTRVGGVDIGIRGPLDDAASTQASGQASTQAHARQAASALRRDWALPAGAPFRDADWSRAKATAIAGVRAQGYVSAEWATTAADVDAARQRADLALTLTSGPLFRVGPLRVQGLKLQDERTVAHIANLKRGQPATEALLLDIQERLQKSDLFDRATVSLETSPPEPDATPVLLQLGERALQEATIGVGVGANVGPRFTLNHVHRRPFSQPWVARNNFDISQLVQRWSGEVSTQTLPGLYRNLAGAGLERVKSDTDTVTSSHLRAGRAQETRNINRLLFVDWNRSTTTSALGRQQSDALSLQYHGVWRRLDDPVLPTRGRAWTGQVAVGQARSEPGGNGPFTRLYGRLDAFQPIGNWYGQGRIELGQVFSIGDLLVPEALRFRAGGDESVRGYAYRSLTRKVNGIEVGSEVLFTASAEVARPLLARLPQLWGALFIDAGRAAGSWGELKPAFGAGVGVRYRSPVGPVKLDLAYGEEERRLRLHLSVGLAF